ncbi:unnamed protein product [Vicia faba]|uniref:Uncharacterized protein n=2 Tax=Fabeae TaxID=163743 RepID=A0AAV0Z267_VICFA|nr:unnamed protein product [Vicia faba]
MLTSTEITFFSSVVYTLFDSEKFSNKIELLCYKFADRYRKEMKKGVHPQKQWISYVTQTGRLMNVMMTKIHPVGKVYHFRAKRQMAESLGQIAKFRRRFGLENPEAGEKK